MWAETSTGCVFGGSAIGERSIKAEDVGLQAVDDLMSGIDSGGCVDHHGQDQVIWRPSTLNESTLIIIEMENWKSPFDLWL